MQHTAYLIVPSLSRSLSVVSRACSRGVRVAGPCGGPAEGAAAGGCSYRRSSCEASTKGREGAQEGLGSHQGEGFYRKPVFLEFSGVVDWEGA
eukprot:6529082-Alexandrium_andersonii.AAC.1